jgi:hypothetical protein
MTHDVTEIRNVTEIVAGETDPVGNRFARTEHLFSLMEAKRAVLAELRNMAILQIDAIDKQDITELLQLLSRKQLRMDRMVALQQQLSTFQGEDPESRLWVTPERRHACQAIKRECDRWIQEILVMEQRAADSMTVQRDALAGQLLQTADSMRVTRAYGFEGDLPDSTEGSLSIDG